MEREGALVSPSCTDRGTVTMGVASGRCKIARLRNRSTHSQSHDVRCFSAE